MWITKEGNGFVIPECDPELTFDKAKENLNEVTLSVVMLHGIKLKQVMFCTNVDMFNKCVLFEEH